MPRIVLLLATLSTGLFAGFCFCYAFVVIPTLSGLDDQQYVQMMRKLNDSVPSVPFFAVFVGSLLWTLVALALHTPLHPTRQTWLIAAAAVFCLIAVVVSVAIEVPANGRLAAEITNTAAQYHQARHGFERTWNAWHAVRTGALTLALGLLAGACLYAPAAAHQVSRSAGATTSSVGSAEGTTAEKTTTALTR